MQGAFERDRSSTVGRPHAGLDETIIDLYPWLIRLSGIIAGRETAEDLAQEVVVRLLSSPPEKQDAIAMKAWMRTTLTRLHWRRGTRILLEARALGKVFSQSGRNPYLEPLPEVSARVYGGLMKLGVRERTCLVLRYVEDLSEDAIGTMLGVRPGTVKAHLAHGRAHLRDVLESRGNTE